MGEETKLCQVELIEKQLEGKKQFLKSLLDQPLFLQAVDSLGRVPRFFQFFLARVTQTQPKPDLAEFLRGLLNLVVDDVKATYNTQKWDMLLGGTREGVRRMVLWSLSRKQVALTDRLNGITVEQARATGILMLEEVKDSHEERYTINMPLILLQAINRTLNDVPDEHLDPVHIIDDQEFEKVMTTLRILRQNMLVNIGKKTATYRELYPHALGYDKDLDQEVPLKRLEEVWVDGSSAARHSMHLYPMNAVPVLNGQQKTIDISKVSFLFPLLLTLEYRETFLHTMYQEHHQMTVSSCIHHPILRESNTNHLTT